jgi:hypothetical protein
LDDQLFDTFAASVQHSASEILQALGWAYLNGRDVSPDGIVSWQQQG